MLKILKKTPINLDGEDCLEVLVFDDSIDECTCCDLCIYNDFLDYMDYSAPCSEVHGCSVDARCYFIKQPLNEKEAI